MWLEQVVQQRRRLDGIALGALKAMERFDKVTGTLVFKMYKVRSGLPALVPLLICQLFCFCFGVHPLYRRCLPQPFYIQNDYFVAEARTF